jgi:signal transduction histidine kinase
MKWLIKINPLSYTLQLEMVYNTRVTFYHHIIFFVFKSWLLLQYIIVSPFSFSLSLSCVKRYIASMTYIYNPHYYIGVDDLVFALLKEKKFEVDSIDSQGRTALHLACANAQLASAACLLKFGASPHALTYSLDTPLALAAKIVNVSEAREWVILFESELNKRKQAQLEKERIMKLEQEKEIQRKFDEARKRRELMAQHLPELRAGLITVVTTTDGGGENNETNQVAAVVPLDHHHHHRQSGEDEEEDEDSDSDGTPRLALPHVR